MINRGRVLLGIGQHIQGSMWDRCEDCPYYSPDAGGIHCRDALLEDLFELIGDLEPRVMTLAEAKEALKTAPVVWLEHNQGHDIYTCLRMRGKDYFITETNEPLYIDDFNPDKYEMFYGRSVRCWTSRPTDEQRRATPWT